MSFDPITMALSSGGGGLPVVEMSEKFSFGNAMYGLYEFTAEEIAALDSAAAIGQPIIVKFSESGCPIALLCNLWLDDSGDSFKPMFTAGLGPIMIMIGKIDGVWKFNAAAS